MGLFDIFKKSAIKPEVNSSDGETYRKIKTLSYWIFNNYGIPVSEAVNKVGENKSIKLVQKLPFNVEDSVMLKIIDDFLFEYLGIEISFRDTDLLNKYVKTNDSVFTLSKKEIYTEPEYNFLEMNYNSHLFLDFNFNTIEVNSNNTSHRKALQMAKDKIKQYKDTFGDVNKPKLICPSPGLSFEEYKIEEIKQEAIDNQITFEENFESIKVEVESIIKNKFIPFNLIYCNPLMETVRWRKGFNHLNLDNEVMYEPSDFFYGEN